MTAVLAIALLFGLVFLLLAVPVAAAFRFEGFERFGGEVEVRWLFGWVQFRIGMAPGHDQMPPRDGAPREAKKPAADHPPRGGGRRALALLRQAPFRRRVRRLLQDLVAAAHLDRLRLDLRLGLGDPADTGRLWAFVGPLAAMTRNLRGAEVRIEPEFMDPVLEFRAEGRMRLVPLQVLALAIVFALSPASIRAWRTLAGRHG
jgi:hypothetical protein